MKILASPRRLALKDIDQFDTNGRRAEAAVDAVFYRLTEPDRDMLAAGAVELERALPKGACKAYVRELAGVVWRAMLEAAR